MFLISKGQPVKRICREHRTAQQGPCPKCAAKSDAASLSRSRTADLLAAAQRYFGERIAAQS